MVGLRRWRLAYAVVVDDRAATAAGSPALPVGVPGLGMPARVAPRRSAPRTLTPLLVPIALAGAYIVLLIVRFPSLIVWLNSQGDYAYAFVLTDAISHGHTGQVVMSTQGGWVTLWFGLATHGLSFHRVLWEISPALLSLATAGVIAGSVARLATRTAGALTFALIVAASPTGLLNLTAPWAHNATLLGAALLGAFLASDQLLLTEGLMPFLIAGVLLAFRARDWPSMLPVAAVATGAAGDNRYGTYRGVVSRQAGRIEALVQAHHLGVGCVGYWDAAPLDWLSHERLHVYPLTRVFGHTEPMSIARVAAWYRPRPNAPLHRPIN